MTDLDILVERVTKDYHKVTEKEHTDTGEELLSLAKREVYLDILAYANKLTINTLKNQFSDELSSQIPI